MMAAIKTVRLVGALVIIALSCSISTTTCSLSMPEIEAELLNAVNTLLDVKTREAITGIREAVERQLAAKGMSGAPIKRPITDELQMEAVLDYLERRTASMEQPLNSEHYKNDRTGWNRYEKIYLGNIEKFCRSVRLQLGPVMEKLLAAFDEALRRPGEVKRPSRFTFQWLNNWIVAEELGERLYEKIDKSRRLLLFKNSVAGKTCDLAKGCLLRVSGKKSARLVDKMVTNLLDSATI